MLWDLMPVKVMMDLICFIIDVYGKLNGKESIINNELGKWTIEKGIK